MTIKDTFLLAGDIGGTKTVLALYPADGNLLAPVRKERFASQEYPSLGEMVTEFLANAPAAIARASFGVAGLVQNDHAQITNLPWVIERAEMEGRILAPVRLLNDLNAIAHAIPFLTPSDLETLNAGAPSAKGTLGVVAPGTGLGEAFLTWSGNRYHAHPSEGGHADFAPRNSLQVDLLNYLQARLGHVSFERVCSGSGIANLFAFLKDSGRYVEPDWLRDELSQAADPAPVIVRAATDRQVEICVAALDLFAEILGSEAGNMALKILATGGIYLAGGIPTRILPWLRKPNFLQAFTQKGRFAGMLKSIPVRVVTNPEVALFGAACHGMEPENFDE
jgi:glucokinase